MYFHECGPRADRLDGGDGRCPQLSNFERSFQPFLISMKAGESDTTQPSLAVTPIFVKTIVLLFPHGIKTDFVLFTELHVHDKM